MKLEIELAVNFVVNKTTKLIVLKSRCILEENKGDEKETTGKSEKERVDESFLYICWPNGENSLCHVTLGAVSETHPLWLELEKAQEGEKSYYTLNSDTHIRAHWTLSMYIYIFVDTYVYG